MYLYKSLTESSWGTY